MIDERLKDIAEIRSLMEENSKFLSLSGLSGVGAGLVALLGAYGTYQYLVAEGIYGSLHEGRGYIVSYEILWRLIGIALLILVFAMGIATFFSWRMAKQKQLRFNTPSSRKVLFAMAIPLVAGAIFCVQLAFYGAGGLTPATTLIFYGMALLNASKYTLTEIRYLGISEIVLGLIAALFIGWGIFFWAFGFGVLHIVYGLIMYRKYEQ